MSEDQGSLWFWRERQGGHEELAIGEIQLTGIDPPHDRVKGAIEDEIAPQVVVAHTNLLVGAVFLIQGLRQPHDRRRDIDGRSVANGCECRLISVSL